MASAAPRGRLRPGPAVPRPRQGKDRLSSTACLTKPAGKAAGLESLTGLRTAADESRPTAGIRVASSVRYARANLRLLSDGLTRLIHGKPVSGNSGERGTVDCLLDSGPRREKHHRPCGPPSGDGRAKVPACSTGSSSTTRCQRVAYTLGSESSVGSAGEVEGLSGKARAAEIMPEVGTRDQGNDRVPAKPQQRAPLTRCHKLSASHW